MSYPALYLIPGVIGFLPPSILGWILRKWSNIRLVGVGVDICQGERKRPLRRRSSHSEMAHQRLPVQKVLGVIHRVDRALVHLDWR